MTSIRKYLEEEPNGLTEDEDKNKSQQNKTSFWVGWRLPFWCKTGDHFRSLICVLMIGVILFCSEWLNITLSLYSNYASCSTIFQRYRSYLKYWDFDVCFKMFVPSLFQGSRVWISTVRCIISAQFVKLLFAGLFTPNIQNPALLVFLVLVFFFNRNNMGTNKGLD